MPGGNSGAPSTGRCDINPHPVDDLFLLRYLPADLKAFVRGSLAEGAYAPGDVLVAEGDPAEAFFTIVEGSARASRRGEDGTEVTLGQLGPGDSFGETALVDDMRRTATIRASTPVRVLTLDRGVFRALLAQYPELQDALALQERHRALANFFRAFTAFRDLPEPLLQRLLASLEPVEASAGEALIREGDPAGPMFVVLEGRLRVSVVVKGTPVNRAFLRAGDFFGELSVLKGTPRTATVTAVSGCRLLALPPDVLRVLLEESPEFRAAVEDRVAHYDFKAVARVPLDFTEELLPAQADVSPPVSPDQVDEEDPDDARWEKPRRRIWRFPDVRQLDEMDCGAASLAMVCRHFGRPVSLTHIRTLTYAGLDGISLRGICDAAEALGLAARAVQAEPEHLDGIPLPAIAHWDGNHWVCVYRVGKSRVHVADPALGHRALSRDEFLKRWSGYAALFDYTDAFAGAPVTEGGISWLLPFARPFRGLLAQALGLAIVVSLLQLLIPMFTQVIVDRVLVDRNATLLWQLLGGMLAVVALISVAMTVQRYLVSFAAVRMDAATLDFITRRLLALPMTYFSTRRTGDIQRRLDGVRQVRDLLVQHGIHAVTSLVQVGVTLAAMFVYSPKLALVFCGALPVYVLLMGGSARWLRPVFADLEDAFGKYHSYQIDAIKGVETIKAMGGEGRFRELMLAQFIGVARRVFKADFTSLAYEGAVQAVSLLTLCVFLFVGAREVLDGRLTVGGLVAFNALVSMATAPILFLLFFWDGLQRAAVLFGRLNDVMETVPEQGFDRVRLRPVRSMEGRVSVRGLGFRYGGPDAPPILDDVSFDAEPGRTIAIVGRSGSGKTTLVKCLAGLLEPTAGSVTFDGVELRTVNYRDLRRHIGFVLQENYLFSDTIAANIAFSDQEPDMPRVIAAADAAAARDFIERLPLAYETKVGETGLALSGGQKQRVAIARALYQNPPVLVFDEATSALDSESERAVTESMKRLVANRTTFVIAHRLSTVRDADLILVLERGKLVERGTHDQLVASRGLYFYLVSQQLAGAQ
jgi:ATP-binding cassette subfamily B protein